MGQLEPTSQASNNESRAELKWRRQDVLQLKGMIAEMGGGRRGKTTVIPLW